MFSENREDDVYSLITELCECLFEKHKIAEDHVYLPRKDNSNILKHLRARAYEILLKKSSLTGNDHQDYDPVPELLKHTYVLQVATGNLSQAMELEDCLTNLTEDGLDTDPAVRSTLIFLNELKSCKKIVEPSLDIFHFGKPNPFLPEVRSNDESPTFQTYPIESFCLSDRLESVLNHNGKNQCSITLPSSKPSLLSQFISESTITNGLEYHKLRDRRTGSLMSTAPMVLSNFSLINEYSMGSFFLPNICEENDDRGQFALCREGIVTEPESPWQCTELPGTDIESETEMWDVQTLSNYLYKKPKKSSRDFNIWEKIHERPEISDYRTWETLGNLDPEKEPLFITDSPDAVTHLARLKHPALLPLLSKKTIDSIDFITEIKTSKFLKNVKLLLLGIESECFTYGNMGSFELKKNLVIPGISVEALENVCFQVIQWGNCFKSLSSLVAPDPQSGKLQVEGLIFKALCNSVNEFLLFYKAAILRINVDEDSNGLLEFLNTARPLGNFIVEIAELCSCNGQEKTSLGEGIGILTHVYDQATKITKPKVALILYSILQSCCEVYFRLLQQWIFEGICDDIYDEFMIKVRTKYLRLRAHRFWTRAFGINEKSVPGFLSELAELILQCGKSVKLLKICDPKNSLFRFSNSHHLPVRVCLSVGMQREQIKFYEEYLEKGQAALGEIVSFSSAIQEQKDEEKRRGELVIEAQRETLLRLKNERDDALRKRAEEKNELLAMLKDQAEQFALRKKKELQAELQADKLLIENFVREEEEAKNIERIEKANTLKYYNELAVEAENRRLRADWRMRRMKLFDERILALSSIKSACWKEEEGEKENEEAPEETANEPEILVIEEPESRQSKSADENSNLTKKEEEIVTVDGNKNTEKTTSGDGKSEETEQKIKPVRPVVLDLTSTKKTDTTAAQKNKFRVLQQEYGISPNNNVDGSSFPEQETEKNMNFISQSFRLEQFKEIQANRLRNTRHRMDDNWGTSDEQKKSSISVSAETQRNKTKMMSHQTGTEIQKPSAKPDGPVSEAQRNRERVMTLSVEGIFEDQYKNEYHQSQPESRALSEIETPMSCTTDYFTQSINSSSIHLPSEENTPYSEVDSDMNFEDAAKSRASDEENPIRVLRERLETRDFLGPGSSILTPASGPALTTLDVEMINSTSLQEHLKKSVMIPLQAQSRLVNNAIIKYFLREHHLLSRLHSFRSYFFLLNGEFAKSLTHALYKRLYKVSSPMEFFNSTMLKHILKKAINCSLSNSANSGLLSLYAVDIPSQLQVSNPEALNYLSLNYKITWPSNIIFDDALIEQYNKVFKFLLMVGRVLWVLQEDFHVLKLEKEAAVSEQFHKIQLYRHSMMQFMNALHTYLTCSVLHASWAEFEKDLENVTTLDEFYTTHVSYIKKILSRCMLTQRGEIMRKCMCTIFNLILKFHNRIRSQKWILEEGKHVHPNYKRLEEMYNSFCQQRAYLAHVAEKLTTSGYQPHLAHFLHALNINNSFKLTLKKT